MVHFLALLALLAAPEAEPSPLWTEARAFRGFLMVHSEAILPANITGEEIQTEKIEFLLVSEPPKRRTPGMLLPLQMRDRSGSFTLRIDQRDRGLVTVGGSEGALHPEVRGTLDPATGRVTLSLSVTPPRIVAKTTLSGMDQGRFRTFRTITERAPFSDGFQADGTFDAEGVFEGTRKATERKAKYSREVSFTWRLERIDPTLKGVALDQHGEPLAGLRVLARTTSPDRVRRRLPPIAIEGVTDERGRFALDAYAARWEIEIEGTRRGESVIEGRHFKEGLLLRLEDAPFTEAQISVYRAAALPEQQALHGAFRDDIAGYFRYIRERVDESRLAAALLAPPGE